MELRVWDSRKSECFAVMAKIRVETLLEAKAGWTYGIGLSQQEK